MTHQKVSRVALLRPAALIKTSKHLIFHHILQKVPKENEKCKTSTCFSTYGRECEPTDSYASPETGSDVTDAGGVAAARGDQETDDPAGDRDLGALVGEDEEGAQHDDARPERREHRGELLCGGRGYWGRGRGGWLSALVLLFFCR